MTRRALRKATEEKGRDMIDFKRNLTLLLDFYEMTMSNGYFIDGRENTRVAFDVFYRRNPDESGFAIFAGLEQVVNYILNMHFDEEDIVYLRSCNIFDEKFLNYLKNFSFHGDVYAFPEGTVMYPNEPIITVVAPVIEAQLVETFVLLQVNHQSLIATKAARLIKAAQGRAVSDFGARRAHNSDAAIYGARAAYIGGAVGTSNVLAAKTFSIPVSGTMAHSYVMFYEDEYTAFKKYAEVYPKSTLLLVDTYDVLKSGVPNAIKVYNDVLKPRGERLMGIRMDSGDLAYLSRKARVMLDEAGLSDCKIVASNSLDEYTISSLIAQGAKIDTFGVGERLITAKSDPVFGAVYKLAAVEENGVFQPRIKISENVEKITNPALKSVYRVYDKGGKAIADLIALKDEKLSGGGVVDYVDPSTPWRKRRFEGCKFVPLQKQIIKNGKLVCKLPALDDIRAFVFKQLDGEIWAEEQRFENPHTHYLDMTPAYYAMKSALLEKTQK
jgi:nicotinate phosphoribosyltransferase